MIDGAPENAAVLLYDPIVANLRLSRRCLSSVGFRKIRSVSNDADLAEALAQDDFELLVGEASGPDDPICSITHRLRNGEIGTNPFMVVVLTSWAHEDSAVRRVLECGADDLLLRPYSINALGDRLRTLVRGRKDFVVTSDYIGPCRRDAARHAATDLISPPNTLNLVCMQGPEALQTVEREIRRAQDAVGQERIRRVAMRMVTSARLALDGEEAASGRREFGGLARDLSARVGRSGNPEAIEIARALTRVADRASRARKASDRDLLLVRDLAMGVYRACAGEMAADAIAGELEDVLGAVKARLAKAS